MLTKIGLVAKPLRKGYGDPLNPRFVNRIPGGVSGKSPLAGSPISVAGKGPRGPEVHAFAVNHLIDLIDHCGCW